MKAQIHSGFKETAFGKDTTGCSTHEGFLQKKNSHGKWQKRWFYLNNEYLIYKKDDHCQDIKGAVDISDIDSIVVTSKGDIELTMRENGAELQLKANDSAQGFVWEDKIRERMNWIHRNEHKPDKREAESESVNPRILVTGGAGFIGSHTVVSLIEAGYDITVVDNYVNSCPESIERVRAITGCQEDRIRVFEVDCCDYHQLESVFSESPTFSACIHFAGLKAVGESVSKPILYYEVNISSISTLLKLMDKYDCHRLVFSSSATVYGSAPVPITESSPTGGGITNAYGRTKYMIEEILKDFVRSKGADSEWSVTVLRYFNPIGAHPSGQIGEDPNGIPNNLMPYVAQVAVGKREKLSVFGDDYDTPDGTGVRDYIHVVDLAGGHLAAIQYMERKDPGYNVFNLGTGKGYSVLEMVSAMEKACGHAIAYEIAPRREGDIAVCYADTTLAREELGWEAALTLEQACEDLWKWQSLNPNGFATQK